MGGKIQRKGEAIGLKQLFDNESSTYTYLLWDTTTKDAVIVDPVDIQVDRDLQEVGDLELNLVYGSKSWWDFWCQGRPLVCQPGICPRFSTLFFSIFPLLGFFSLFV